MASTNKEAIMNEPNTEGAKVAPIDEEVVAGDTLPGTDLGDQDDVRGRGKVGNDDFNGEDLGHYLSPLEHPDSTSSIEIGCEDDEEASIVVFAPLAKLLFGDRR